MTGLLPVLALLASSASASHEPGQAFTGADIAQNANNLLIANPPLPMLWWSPGDWKLSLQPFYLKGDVDAESAPGPGGASMDVGSEFGQFGARRTGEFSGGGAAVTFSYGLTARWGAYVLAQGVAGTGDFEQHALTTPTGGEPGSRQVLDAESSHVIVGAGLTRRFFGDEPGEFTLAAFLGPMVTKARATQRMVVRNPNGTVRRAYDLEVSETIPGLLGGVHTSVRLSEGFRLNPFVVAGASLSDDMEPAFSNVGPSTGIGTDQSLYNKLHNPSFLGAGFSVTYAPWDLTVNLTAPLLGEKGDLLRSMEGFGMKIFSLSWSFGRFPR